MSSARMHFHDTWNLRFFPICVYIYILEHGCLLESCLEQVPGHWNKLGTRLQQAWNILGTSLNHVGTSLEHAVKALDMLGMGL